MGAISQDLSTAGMAAAIEANWIGVFGLWSNTPSIEVHDDEPDLRWYITPGVPVPLFNHVYFSRLAQQENIDARIEEVIASFAEHEVPFMWSAGPFTQPPISVPASSPAACYAQTSCRAWRRTSKR
jgi:hypothetical protein